MAIKGLADILAKYRNGELNESQFEEELGKGLATAFIPKTKFNEVNEAKKLAETNLANANNTLNELRQKGDLSDEYKKQIEALNAQIAQAQKEHESQLLKMRLDTAIESSLQSAKAKNLKATRALLDESKLAFAEDGSVTGLKEQIEAIQKDNGFLFDIEQSNPRKPSWGSPQVDDHNQADTLEAQMYAAAGLDF